MSIHLGIIPDGNRRWCKKNNKTNLEYAIMIQNIIKNLCEESKEVDTNVTIPYPTFKLISEISIYLLSNDNLVKRDTYTIDIIEKILDLVCIVISMPTYNTYFKFNVIGNTDLLPLHIQEQIQKCVALANGDFQINLAIGYDPVEDSKLYLEQGFESRNQIDLVIRTGGQLRSSGFFPLQTLYSEWVYLDKLWPDITREDINLSILEFNTRQRNFGK